MITQTDIILSELGGLYGQKVLADMGEILRYYDFYEGRGQHWRTAENLDYRPTQFITNLTKKLIKREARFMFGRTPELRVRDRDGKRLVDMQTLLDMVLEDNSFPERLMKGARDCFIGKRVALKLTCDGGNIGITFRPSTEFVFTPYDEDADRLSKIIFFYQTADEPERVNQRVWRQKYEMENGRCFVTEGTYDGYGNLIDGGEKIDTGLDFIPCRVIINDGLTGDLCGESDVAEIMANQQHYNRLKSDDIDALRFNMFPQRVAIDADGKSLESMKFAPGALVDLVTDPAVGDSGEQASLELLESKFSYDARFEHTLNRIKEDMHELLGVPNLSLEQLQGLMQSGKSMKALYWELIERCEERWTVWEPALKWMCRTVFRLVGACMPDLLEIPENYGIYCEHLYPIMEDEEEERRLDLSEVQAGVRSAESYRSKWQIFEN